MLPFVRPIDAFHDSTAPHSWLESLVKAHVGDGLAADFYREIAEWLDPDTRDLVFAVLADTGHSAFAVREVRRACQADPAAGRPAGPVGAAAARRGDHPGAVRRGRTRLARRADRVRVGRPGRHRGAVPPPAARARRADEVARPGLTGGGTGDLRQASRRRTGRVLRGRGGRPGLARRGGRSSRWRRCATSVPSTSPSTGSPRSAPTPGRPRSSAGRWPSPTRPGRPRSARRRTVGPATDSSAGRPCRWARPTAWGAFYAELRLLPYARAAHRRGTLDDCGSCCGGARLRAAARPVNSTTAGPRPGSTATCGPATCSTPAAAWCSSTRRRTAATARPTWRCWNCSGCRTWTGWSPPTPKPRLSRRTGADRTGLHQLHPLLVHAVSHDGSYGVAAGRLARRYA